MAWSTCLRSVQDWILPRSCSGRSVRPYIDVNQLGSRSRILTLSMLTLCSGLSVLTWKRDSRVLSVSPMYLSMHFSLPSPPQANLSLLLYAILSVQQRKGLWANWFTTSSAVIDTIKELNRSVLRHYFRFHFLPAVDLNQRNSTPRHLCAHLPLD